MTQGSWPLIEIVQPAIVIRTARDVLNILIYTDISCFLTAMHRGDIGVGHLPDTWRSTATGIRQHRATTEQLE